ncbi:MAG: hypothetical protein ACF8PN_11530 [Phycisphaerales bacterium]
MRHRRQAGPQVSRESQVGEEDKEDDEATRLVFDAEHEPLEEEDRFRVPEEDANAQEDLDYRLRERYEEEFFEEEDLEEEGRVEEEIHAEEDGRRREDEGEGEVHPEGREEDDSEEDDQQEDGREGGFDPRKVVEEDREEAFDWKEKDHKVSRWFEEEGRTQHADLGPGCVLGLRRRSAAQEDAIEPKGTQLLP